MAEVTRGRVSKPGDRPSSEAAMKMWFSVGIGTVLLGLVSMPAPVLAQQKTVKTCQDEWRANRAENQAKGITEKAYVAQCRAGSVTAQATAPVPPAAAKSAPPVAATPKAAAPAATPSPAKTAPTAVTTPTGANQFSTEALAKARC